MPRSRARSEARRPRANKPTIANAANAITENALAEKVRGTVISHGKGVTRPLAMNQRARHRRKIVSDGRRVSHMFDVNTSLELYEPAQFAWQSRIAIRLGV
jgi:hypothetical protein